MKNILNQLSVIFLLLSSAYSLMARLDVVATTPDLAAIAREIGGSRITLTTLAKPTEDAHFVDAKPSYVVKLSKADALIEGGAELEIGWLTPLIEQSRNSKLLPGSPGRILANHKVSMQEIPTALDRSKGDIHAAGNPHFLMDPFNAILAGEHIAERFCAIDPAGAQDYRANLKQFTDQLRSKVALWQEKLEPVKGRPLVSYHNSWIYFASRFGLKTGIFLEPKPGIPPTPAHLARVIAKMREDKATLILADPYINRKIAEKVAAESGAVVVDVCQFPGGIKGTESGYIPMMDFLVNAIANTLIRK